MARSTIDVDVVADLQPEHAAPLARHLEENYYADNQGIRQSILEQRSFNVIYTPTMHKIDIFPVKSREFDRSALGRIRQRRVAADDPGSLLPLASAEDVVLNKLEWYRMGDEMSERQWLDVVSVMKVQANHLEQAYLDRWAKSIGVDLLERARTVGHVEQP